MSATRPRACRGGSRRRAIVAVRATGARVFERRTSGRRAIGDRRCDLTSGYARFSGTCGGDGDRTHYLLHAMQALYQLSYAPDGGFTLPADSPALRSAATTLRRVTERADDIPTHRYNAGARQRDRARVAGPLGRRARVLDAEPHRPAGRGPARASPTGRSLFVLDMFPYPSGVGLHVGHPLGFIATDVYARFQRMNGFNVLHAMGYDAFGLPAEQYAVQTGTHPRVTTEANIANMKRQLRALGLGHDPRRGPATTDVDYYRWTQWIFLQIYNSWYDDDADRARPIARARRRSSAAGRVRDARRHRRSTTLGPLRAARSSSTRYRLAYVAEAPVNWCPGLGTVLANEEVTADGRSERGNFPVYRRPLKQWMMRITAYADRLLADLDELDWSDSIKLMQRNWIGRSTGASVRFPVEGHDGRRHRGVHDAARHVVRRDLHGARARAPARRRDHRERVARRRRSSTTGRATRSTRGRASSALTDPPPEAVRRYREFAAAKSELERQAEGREKTGVFTGAFAINPTNDAAHPDLHRRLRADGLRHRRDHGGARARRARLRVRARVRAADRAGDPPERRVARRARRGRRRRERPGPRRTSATASR